MQQRKADGLLAKRVREQEIIDRVDTSHSSDLADIQNMSDPADIQNTSTTRVRLSVRSDTSPRLDANLQEPTQCQCLQPSRIVNQLDGEFTFFLLTSNLIWHVVLILRKVALVSTLYKPSFTSFSYNFSRTPPF